MLADGVRSAEGDRRTHGAAATRWPAEVEAERRSRLEGDERGRQLLAGLDVAEFAAAATAVHGPGLTVTVTEPGAAATSATCPSSASRAAGR